jgi:diacylglycerol kinase family enzyme
VGSRVPLAVIPRGTGNQVARNLGLPLRIRAAVAVAVRGEARAIDLGEADGRPFALLAGAGLDARVMTAATRELKERWGFSAYLYAAVREALSLTPVGFRIVADGKALELSAVTVMVANVGALFARGLPVRLPLTPHLGDAWSDGLFDVLVVAPRRPADWAGVLWAAGRARFGGSDRLLHLQARTVEIETDRPLPTQIDGDVVGRTPLSARVLPGALRVLLPPTVLGAGRPPRRDRS